jgi:hypothetical protein
VNRQGPFKTGTTLALLGVGATVVAGAFAVRPVHAPPPIFWAIIGLGALLLVVAAVASLSEYIARQSDSGREEQRPEFAAECRRVEDSLTELIAQREAVRPRVDVDGSEEIGRWRRATAAAYRDLRPWIRQVFNEAVERGLMFEAARPLIDRPPVDQLSAVRDIFRETAERIEQHKMRRVLR